MFLLILTLTLCLTKALENFEITSPPDYSTDPIYNVYPWISELQLQRCALVAIGLKYFAIFVEDEILRKHGPKQEIKYFLGICHQDVLENWNFCSPALAEKRKYKCRFKLKENKFHPRVHRRFCDFKVMINNKDCKCAPSIFGDDLIKVRGFPTCYIPPLPSSLCTYNVCGMKECIPSTVQNRIYTVKCSSRCKKDSPFCEGRTERTSRFPTVKSHWSKWRRSSGGGSGRHSVATCINKYTGRAGLDCLGPGSGCCPAAEKNCTCETFEDNGVLKVKRTIYGNKAARHHRFLRSPPQSFFVHPNIYRYLRGTSNEDEDVEDDDNDDDEEDDLNEDIVLEEGTDEEKPVSTTETLEKEEAVQELQKEYQNATKLSNEKINNNCQRVHTCKFPIDVVAGISIILCKLL